MSKKSRSTVCAGSIDHAFTETLTDAVTEPLNGPWELDPQVALRPEPFGALAYHYGNRRLTFLRSHDLVDLVQTLGDHGSVEEALAASQIQSQRWPSFRGALGSLAHSQVIRPRG